MSFMLSRPLVEARAHLWEAQRRFNYFPDLNIVINDSFVFNFKSPETIGLRPSEVTEPFLKCYLEPDILHKLLTKEMHWNNLEVACLIEFDRRPNVYMPDVHTLMSFFHT